MCFKVKCKMLCRNKTLSQMLHAIGNNKGLKNTTGFKHYKYGITLTFIVLMLLSQVRAPHYRYQHIWPFGISVQGKYAQ